MSVYGKETHQTSEMLNNNNWSWTQPIVLLTKLPTGRSKSAFACTGSVNTRLTIWLHISRFLSVSDNMLLILLSSAKGKSFLRQRMEHERKYFIVFPNIRKKRVKYKTKRRIFGELRGIPILNLIQTLRPLCSKQEKPSLLIYKSWLVLSVHTKN